VHHHTSTIIDFITQIGIEVETAVIEEETFLPGILIKDGKILIDHDKLLYPGDLLHEAGHLAVMSSSDRQTSAGNIGEQKEYNQQAGEEMMAIAWSYAALTHLQLQPEVVFHPDGYKGSSNWLIEQYTGGKYIALPTLQWIGLCYDEKRAEEMKAKPFPHMLKWLRD
jgi:hypothetical protein